MTKKIAFEEACSTPSTRKYLEITLQVASTQQAKEGLAQQLEDPKQWLTAKEESGVDLFVMSQTSPGVQAEADAATAVKNAQAANNWLHDQINRYPDQLRGFAHLALQDVQAACDELTRCVKELGFLGAMINGNTNGHYLDDPSYMDFWQTANDLKVPVYVHPANPFKQPYVLKDHPEMQGAVWGWTTDNSSHFLRLVFSGLFDKLPDLTVILGHMGETLPYFLWRIDGRYEAGGNSCGLRQKPSYYFRNNLCITTTGVCQDSALQCAVAELGEDRVMFSVDYPYENAKESADWIEGTTVLDQARREKVCHQNAERVLKL